MVASSFHSHRFYRAPASSSGNGSFRHGASIGKNNGRSASRSHRLAMFGAGQGRDSPLVKNQQQINPFAPSGGGRWTPEGGDKEEVTTFTTEPTVNHTTPLVKPLALQPTDRAEGDGWQICRPTEKADWGVVGCDTGSCFLFLYNENRANECEVKERVEEARSLSRCSSQVSMMSEELKATTVMC